QPPGQPNGGNIGDTQGGAVRHTGKLILGGPVQLRDPGAVGVAPERGNAGDVLPPPGVHNGATMGTPGNDRRLRGVGLHGSEGMPQVVAVPAFERFRFSVHVAGSALVAAAVSSADWVKPPIQVSGRPLSGPEEGPSRLRVDGPPVSDL